jgi:type I restriction enzyme R subunit
VQHSAGSGKPNTIAWLAHRLSTLHVSDTKVFDRVVVITDRVVLDRQLQDTIYQFEHAHGVVERIEKSSQQLADALAGERARVIITTLQKFPFVLDKVEALPGRRYAVIVDEAHSSQTGEAAEELRRVLGAGAGKNEDAELPPDAVEEALAEAVAARRRQENMSFFAFTATPKGKTLELFGRLSPTTGKHEPFHLYSMRQAIEERFIHDVLANYTTYETFFHLEKAITDDPAYETAKARRAIARFVTLHEHNLAQKAEIVVEHFRAHIAHKIAGQAKAMVVCSSRPHAVRFWQALRTYIGDHGYDLGVLVAFSDAVPLNGGDPVSEARCNGFPESQTAERFDTDEYQLMVVAEKFQTGFDQPSSTPCTWTRPSPGWPPCRPCPASTAPIPTRTARSSSTSSTTPTTSPTPSSPTTAGRWPRRRTRTCSTTPATPSTSSASSTWRRPPPSPACSWPSASTTAACTPPWARPSTASGG